MTQTDSETKLDQNYVAAHFGPFEKLNQYKFGHEGLPSSLSRHLRINTSLAFPSMMVLAKTNPSLGPRRYKTKCRHTIAYEIVSRDARTDY